MTTPNTTGAKRDQQFEIEFQKENSATNALASLLRRSPRALNAFWTLAKRPSAPAKLPPSIEVDHLHITDQGREIDLLLHLDDFAVIIEVKVLDDKKPYQCDAYYDYWKRAHGSEPHMVWLLEQERRVLGDDRYPSTTITWNKLKSSLKSAATRSGEAEAKLIRSFCSALTKAGIGLQTKAKPPKRCLGYERDHAEFILKGILSKVPHFEGAPMTINSLSPALHAGRPEWRTALADSWVRRIWLYLIPLTSAKDQKGPYYFQGQILLFQGGFSDKASPKLSKVSDWAEQLRTNGLILWKNEPNTWHRNMPLAKGEGVHRGIRHIFGEESLTEGRNRFPFDWKNDSAAIEAGAKHLVHFAKLFHRILEV